MDAMCEMDAIVGVGVVRWSDVGSLVCDATGHRPWVSKSTMISKIPQNCVGNYQLVFRALKFAVLLAMPRSPKLN